MKSAKINDFILKEKGGLDSLIESLKIELFKGKFLKISK